MKKSLVFGIVAITILIGLGVFVSALTADDWATGEMSYSFSEGWNLVYGLYNLEGSYNQLEGQVLTSSDIKVVYAFIPTTQEYARVYPNPELAKLNLLDDDELINTAFWVYSSKSVQSEYWLVEQINPLSDRPMYAGWNFVGITPDMVPGPQDTNLKDLKGNCNIEKSYVYFNGWEEMPVETAQFDTKDHLGSDPYLVGSGWVIKVSDNCKLGLASGGSVPLVPALP